MLHLRNISNNIENVTRAAVALDFKLWRQSCEILTVGAEYGQFNKHALEMRRSSGWW